jgi:ubiquinone/menaquinone biosynthesis C-methylase UbiE
MVMVDLRPSRAQYFFGSRAKFLYELIGWHLRHATDLRFMNYGFAFDGDEEAPHLRNEDEAERYCAQLYHALAGQTDLTGKRVLDVGSGRGGGASYMHRYHGTREMVGCDLANRAISFCRRVYDGIDGLSFRQGNAMDLPFGAGEFDAVTNVESSHCYPDLNTFLAEVFRVLKPGGHFLYTDFTPPRGDPKAARRGTLAALDRAGFGPVGVTDITRNIVRGLECDHQRRAREIGRRFPLGTRRAVKLWAGVPGSWIYRDFAEGRRDYLMYCATKPALAEPVAAPVRHLSSTSTKVMEPEPALMTLCSTPVSRR